MLDIARRQQLWTAAVLGEAVAVVGLEGEVMTSTVRYHAVTHHGPI